MRGAFPAAEVWTLYGPTEVTIVSAVSQVGEEGGRGWQRMGRALPGERLYVCDAGGNLLPAGVPGSCGSAGRGWRGATWAGRS